MLSSRFFGHKSDNLLAAALLTLLSFSATAWTPPQKLPSYVVGGFFTIYGEKGNAWHPPKDFPVDIKKGVNVWVLAFVHAYDKTGGNNANPAEGVFYGKNYKPYPDEGALQPPTEDHVILAYEQQRWGNEPGSGDTDYTRLKTMVDAAHENGAIALLSLGYGGDLRRINAEQNAYPDQPDQWEFPKSVIKLVKLLGADGFDIDCEEAPGLKASTMKALKEVFDKAGKEDGRKYFLTMDTAHDYEDEAASYCDMVLDQTYSSDHYSTLVPKYISGNKFVVGASYETGSCDPSTALSKYEKYSDTTKQNGCLGCFLWNVYDDGKDYNWEGLRTYFIPNIKKSVNLKKKI